MAVFLLLLAQAETEIKRFPMDKPIEASARSQSGSAVPLFELPDPGVEDTTLIYEAQVRTENLEGRAYLEMWCRFPDRGEFFSRGFDHALGGTRDWTTLRTPFYLKKGEKPDLVKLNLVLEGKGTAWIRDVRLLRGAAPWFDASWAGIVGGAAGGLLGIWGALAGLLSRRGKARQFVMTSMAIIAVACALMFAAGAAALLLRQPYHVWFPLALIGALGTVIPGAHMFQMLKTYRVAERRKMSAQDL